LSALLVSRLKKTKEYNLIQLLRYTGKVKKNEPSLEFQQAIAFRLYRILKNNYPVTSAHRPLLERIIVIQV